MLFEDMQKIWDTQNNEPMYTIDENALHEHIKNKAARINRSVNALEWGLVLINFFVMLFLAYKMVEAGKINYNLVILLVVALVTIYILRMGHKRKRGSSAFDLSILGQLDKAISEVDYMIGRVRSFFWWYLTPFAVVVSGALILKGSSVGIWLVMVSLFALAAILPYWELRYMHEPRKRTLLILRRTMIQEI